MIESILYIAQYAATLAVECALVTALVGVFLACVALAVYLGFKAARHE